jgi:hypothetical protein
MTHPVEIQIDCADCGRPPVGALIGGRCTRCHLAHGVATYAAEHGIRTTIVRTTILRARVSATGADGRPAWLDTLADVRYLAAELEYHGPPPTPLRPTKRWARQHDRCIECGTDSRPHLARGLCARCYHGAHYRATRGPRLDRNPGRPSGNTVRIAA